MSAAFRVLRFSPNPEEVEYINVALIITDGKHELIFDDRFPKLACIAPHFDKTLLAAYLTHFQRRLRDVTPSEVPAIITKASSQFVLTNERKLADTDDMESVVDALSGRFLARPGGERSRAKGARQVETRLQTFLNESVGLAGVRMHKRASPDSFLSKEVLQELGPNGFRVARVLDGKKRLVLVDGVVMGQPPALLRTRADHINFAYYRINQVRTVIERQEKRSCARAVVLFDMPETLDPRQEFVLETLSRYSDYTFPESEPPMEFVQQSREAALSLFG